MADLEASRKVEDLFILEWGRMSSSWGINRTMAQIHALLLITGRQFTVDEIIERLQISRGNASMNLRELMDWGIIRRVRHPGERKDLYASIDDVHQVFARVIRERKRREIDPTVEAIKECLDAMPETEPGSERLKTLLNIFTVIDMAYQQVFANDETFRETVALFVQREEKA
jgi:DNA-binding transcriptional regulator GbsR (MarR family)